MLPPPALVMDELMYSDFKIGIICFDLRVKPGNLASGNSLTRVPLTRQPHKQTALHKFASQAGCAHSIILESNTSLLDVFFIDLAHG